jgi:hypothetical protein
MLPPERAALQCSPLKANPKYKCEDGNGPSGRIDTNQARLLVELRPALLGPPAFPLLFGFVAARQQRHPQHLENHGRRPAKQ